VLEKGLAKFFLATANFPGGFACTIGWSGLAGLNLSVRNVSVVSHRQRRTGPTVFSEKIELRQKKFAGNDRKRFCESLECQMD
jgi:hypothetical protein